MVGHLPTDIGFILRKAYWIGTLWCQIVHMGGMKNIMGNFCKTTPWITTMGVESKNLTPYKNLTGCKHGPDKNHRGMNDLKALITVALLIQHFENPRS